MQTKSGCDSTVTTTITVNAVKKTNQTFTICPNQKISVGDTVYQTTGDYKRTLRTAFGCDSVVMTKLTVRNEVTFSQKLKICAGLSVSVGDTVYKTTGTYLKKIRSTEGCDSLVTTHLEVIKFDLNLPNDTTINLGDSVRLSVSTSAVLSTSFKWTPANTVRCDTCPTTWAKPNGTTQYQVEVFEKDAKCRQIGRVLVRTKTACSFYIPTAFSPNGDNMNDVLMLHPSACVKRIKRFAIFNRWGDLLVSKNDMAILPNQALEMWDGTFNRRLLDNATFVYVVEAEYINGESEILGGDVILIK
ncbi:MAG: gliding motility-associated C-terminal domain-containing protein [Saprospiraceae bacterium]|nr:gliding motility-associated C-terminal domain-containing protein [Saprospiraceae bacterium]